MKHNQQGVGLIEVMVALTILAIAVLGYSAMQIRAVSTSIEAGNNVLATSLARDLAERLRVNRDGLKAIQQDSGAFIGDLNAGMLTIDPRPTTPITPDCSGAVCDAEALARHDALAVAKSARSYGMQMQVHECQGSRLARSCIYVSWGDTTTPTDGEGDNDCTNRTAYRPHAQCIIMEIYNRD